MERGADIAGPEGDGARIQPIRLGLVLLFSPGVGFGNLGTRVSTGFERHEREKEEGGREGRERERERETTGYEPFEFGTYSRSASDLSSCSLLGLGLKLSGLGPLQGLSGIRERGAREREGGRDREATGYEPFELRLTERTADPPRTCPPVLSRGWI